MVSVFCPLSHIAAPLPNDLREVKILRKNWRIILSVIWLMKNFWRLLFPFLLEIWLIICYEIRIVEFQLLEIIRNRKLKRILVAWIRWNSVSDRFDPRAVADLCIRNVTFDRVRWSLKIARNDDNLFIFIIAIISSKNIRRLLLVTATHYPHPPSPIPHTRSTKRRKFASKQRTVATR